MARRQEQEQNPKSNSQAGRVELGYLACENYKARLTKGLLGVDLGEGYIVEILNFMTKRVLRRELFDDSDDARDELARIRDDIEKLTTEEFRKKYLQRPS
ncbi:MAG TPA: hypothetical protein VIK22_04305 [Candidatus Anoxymicrobiaceae bacterium]|jgi:hypothetical protein